MVIIVIIIADVDHGVLMDFRDCLTQCLLHVTHHTYLWTHANI
jgi:hypothetical protein